MANMDLKKQFLCLILLLLKGTIFAFTNPSLSSLLQYNITNVTNQWFSKILAFDIPSAARNLDAAFKAAVYYKIKDFEYDLDHAVNDFQSKFFFHDVVYYVHRMDDYNNDATSNLVWDLQKNEIRALLGMKRRITVEGEWYTAKDKLYTTFFTTLHFKNLTLLANASAYIDFSYDELTLWNHLIDKEVKWSHVDLRYSNSYLYNSTFARILTTELKPALITMLREHFNRNDQFSREFKNIFGISKQVQNDLISSSHPDMFQKGRKYYYYIAKIPMCCGFSLKDVVIRGLTNIKFLNMSRGFWPTLSLLMKKIHGSAVLDYGREEGKFLELTFKIDSLAIRDVKYNNNVHIEASGFGVNSTSGPLTNNQSAIMKHLIKSAVISSIMPSKIIHHSKSEAEVPIEIQLKVKQVWSDWKEVKKICRDYIPFAVKTKKH